MKIALGFGDGEVSWRAENTDSAGILRLEMLKSSVGMNESPDDGTATCRIVPGSVFTAARGVGIPQHGMRIDFARVAECGAEAAFCDGAASEENLNVIRWRGVRKLLFLGLVPRMLSRECAMVHGALMEKCGRGVLLCCFV